jgi:hypothetical protein
VLAKNRVLFFVLSRTYCTVRYLVIVINSGLVLGRTLNQLGRYEEAEVAYWSAKTLLPRARPGEKLVTRYSTGG